MTQTIRITKQFNFDMAHALYGHDGPCRNIHGHTYALHICLKGKPLNHFGHPKDGMVIDFTELKTIVTKQILERYDHALVLNGDSPHAELDELRKNFEKIVYMENQPTCENLVIEMAQRLKGALPEGVSLCWLRLMETPTSGCEWHASEN